MDRLEYVQGSSAKFWEVEQDGATLTTRWGRIGTAGQSKSKTYGDAAQATDELAKQKAKKLKKGYVQVSGATPTLTPAPTPTSNSNSTANSNSSSSSASNSNSNSTSVALADAPIEWTSTLRRRVHPRRGDWAKSIPGKKGLAGAKADWAQLCGWFDGYRSGNAMDQVEKEQLLQNTLIREANRVVMSKPELPPLDQPELLAAIFILTRTADLGSQKGNSRPSTLLKTVLKAKGASIALLVIEAVRALQPKDNFLFSPSFVSATDEYDANWKLARTWLSSCPQDDWEHARDQAERLGPFTGKRELLAYTFPDEPDWANDAARALLARPEPVFGPYSTAITDLLCSVNDPALARALGERMVPGSWTGVRFAFVAATVLANCGPTLGPWFAELALEMAALSGAQGSPQKVMAQAAAAVRHGEVADVILRWLEQSKLRPLGRETLTAWPDLALPRLRASDRRQAKDLLQIVEATSGPTDDEAPVEALPPALATPPWERKKTRIKTGPPVPGLSVPSPPPRLAWHPDEDARRAAGALRYEASAWDRKELKHDLKRGNVRVSDLDGLPADEVRGLWLNRPNSTWNMTYLRDQESAGLVTVLARVGEDAIPGVIELAERHPKECLAALVHIASPRAAAPMLAAFSGATRQGLIRGWALRHPEEAALGLIPPAVATKSGAPRKAARTLLADLVLAGHAQIVEAAAATHGPGVRAALNDLLDADPADLVSTRKPKLPAFWQPAALPRPTLDGAPIPLAAVDALGGLLQLSTLEQPHPLLAASVAPLDTEPLARFAQGLFDAWLAGGAPNKQAWAMEALARIGDDACARSLGSKVRQWPRQSAGKRAQHGLEVLAELGTDAALLELAATQNVRFKALKARAAELMTAVAKRRGLTSDALEDRLVPDPADLNARALKKAHRTLLHRLERAMCTARSWSPAEFTAYLATPPLVAPFAEQLVWQLWPLSSPGEAIAVRPVDGALRDLAGAVITPGEADRITLAHPVALDDATLAAWRPVLPDQPFEQLDRFVLRGGDPAKALVPFLSQAVPTKKILDLQDRGWVQAYVDSGVLCELTRAFPNGAVVRMELDDGPYLPEPQIRDEAVIDELRATGDLDPIAVSELARDQAWLTS